MDDKKDILSNWKRRKCPPVPDSFFEQFLERLMLRIEDESGILGELKKSEKPEVPQDFFNELLSGLPENESTFNVEELKKGKLPELPTDYFTKSEEQIMELIQQESSTKKGRIIPIRIVAAVTTIAAVFAIIFMTVDFGNENSGNFAGTDDPISSDTTGVITEENYDTYLTYLDESEIIDYIIENDIEIEDTTVQYDEYLDYSEDDLEDFYLDDIEFL